MTGVVENGVEFFSGGKFGFTQEYLSNIFDEYYSSGKSDVYPNVADYKVKDIHRITSLNKIYEALQKKLSLNELGFSLSKLWLVDTKTDNVDISKLPYIPHIDFQRYLKVMVYVDAVTDLDGPFTARPTPPAEFEKLRKALSLDYKKNHENLITKYELTEYIKFEAEGGSVLVFDTNCPHFAGEVKDGGHRRVFRFDFERPEWRRDTTLTTRLRARVRKLFEIKN